MYRVRIRTKYNTIEIKTNDTNDPQLLEVLEQPYVLEVYVEQIENEMKLIKEK